MSTEENQPPVNNIGGEPGPTAQPAPVAQAAAPVTPAPAPVAEPTHRDKHTAQNTTMKRLLPTVDEVLRDLTDEEKSNGFMTVFLGNQRDDIRAAQMAIAHWLAYNSTKSLFNEERVAKETMTKAESDWAAFVEQNHPDKTTEEVANWAADTYTFMSELQNELLVRTRIMNEEGVTNVSDRGGKIVTGDIVGKKPSRSTKGFGIAEIMERSALNATADKLIYDVLLRNSFASLSFTRPSPDEIGNLLNDIRRTIKGYVRALSNNTAVIARVAIVRELWNFLKNRITNSSVSDIGDFGQLANVIRFSDMEALATALIESLNTKGVPLNLRCISNKCDWNAFKQVDVSKLLRIRHSVITDEDHAVYANLINGHAKYTAEETLAMSRASTFNLETDRVYNDDQSIYLEIGNPTLAEALNTFDYFVAQINPKLADIRSKVLDPEEYQAQISTEFNNLGSTEFLHWIKGYVNLPPANSDEEIIHIKRHEADDLEFNKGLMLVLKRHHDLNANLTKFVLNKTPYMSRTFFGVRNYVCPKCGQNTGDTQDPHEYLERKAGYTPIDPFMSFFILTQLLLMNMTLAHGKVRSEALTD